MKSGRLLRVALCEVERGLYHVAYRADGPPPERYMLPPYQVGTSASDAMQRIEYSARECGFEAVIWESDLPDRSLPSAVSKEGVEA